MKEGVNVAGTFEDSMSQSTQDFQKHVLPIFKNLYPNYKFIRMENEKNEIAFLLDTHAGIDFLIVDKMNKTLKGLASRVQRVFRCWKTFTVRYERDNGTATEYKKREQSLKDGGLYAAWTSQAYISPDNSNILGIAITSTVELWEYIEKEHPQIKHTHSDQCGQASFFVIPWRDMREKQYPILTITPKDDGYLAEWNTGKRFIAKTA